jgi:hypothetical protein
MLPDMYGWQIFSDEEIMEEEYGDHSVEECLENAVCEVPPSVPMVEILFCGFHMGMISTSDIRKSPQMTARQIISLHEARSHCC